MKITVQLFDNKSINRAIKRLEEYKAWIIQKEEELLTQLAWMGATRVKWVYARPQYDGDANFSVSFDVDQSVATISANGQAVAFVEFGAGVWFNDAESYPLPRPDGIVGIGQYGKGKGNNPNGWWYSKDGNSRYTRGNPPAMAFYKAKVEIEESIGNVAREVFKR